jgi:two-component system phosphate regulon response regulator PhoB
LVLRVKAVLRRNETIQDILSYDSLKVDVKNYTVSIDDKKINLTAMELKLLVALMRNKGNVQTREYLLEEVWDSSSDVTTRTIDTHVKKLRQKLGRYGDNIETVRSVGYRFME